MKIAIVGNLCQVGYIITKALRKLGYDVHLYINCKNNKMGFAQNPWEYDNLPKEVNWIKLFEMRPILKAFFYGRQSFKNYDLVIAITLFPGYVQFFNKNFVSIATGSDLREFVFQKGIYNFLLKRAYKQTRHLFYLTPNLGSAVQKLDIEKHSSYLPLPIDIDKYNQNKINIKNNCLTLFWPSNWSIRLKGADKFLKACANLFDEGYDFKMKLIDRSKNLALEKKILEKKDIEFVSKFIENYKDKITLLDLIEDRKKLIKEYWKSDIIADHFALGSFGYTTLEAMTCHKPVLVYFDKKYDKYYNNEAPPVINCCTQQEIYESLKQILEDKNRKESLENLGEKAYLWVKKFHDSQTAIKQILKYIL